MGEVVSEVHIPAQEGRGIYLQRGQHLEIIALEGKQVGDLICWNRDDPSEYMSPAHTVSCNASIRLGVGKQIFTNMRNPIFSIVQDDVALHDIVVPCCDLQRYERDFGKPDHRHCLGNLVQARDLLREKFDLRGEQAWNVFMHNRIEADGKVVTDPAAHPPGSKIVLKAEMNLVALLSACPQDLTPCNAFNPTPMKMIVRS